MGNRPEQFDVEEAGVYIAGINGFGDCVVVPLIMAMRGMKRPGVQQVLSRFLMWGINTFSRAPFGAVLKLEAEGEKTGGDTGVFEVVAYHGDSYFFAAAAVVAGLMQYFDGSIARPGLRVMGHEVDSIRLLSDMRRFGVTIQRSWKE